MDSILDNENVRFEELISLSEAARLRSVSRTTVYRAIERGDLSATLIAGRQVLARGAVLAWQPASHGGKRQGQGRPPGTKKAQEEATT